MSGMLDDGRPLVVEHAGDRIGRGPWSRLFATALVPAEWSEPAERGRELAGAGAVHTVAVGRGLIAAEVEQAPGRTCRVTIAADAVPPRIWTSIARFARGNRPLQVGVEGRAQSVHLEHLMTVDWEEPLVPPRHAVRRACTCGAAAMPCEHVAAVAYVLADRFDREPALLLRWRGCVETDAGDEPEPDEPPAPPIEADAWHGRPLPALGHPRPLPVGAVLKRLGPSGLRVGGRELEDVLGPAYLAFAAAEPSRG